MGVFCPSCLHLAWGHCPLPRLSPKQKHLWKAGTLKVGGALLQKSAGGPGRPVPEEDGTLTKECPWGEAGARESFSKQHWAQSWGWLPHPHAFSTPEARGCRRNAFPLARSRHKDKGTKGPGGFLSGLSDACPVSVAFFL